MAVGTPGAIRAVPPAAGSLGQGVAYPLSYDARGRLALSFGPQAVADALSSICQTQPGERVMNPSYGGGVGVFEPIDPGRMIIGVQDNVDRFEPRIKQINVAAGLGDQQGQGLVTVEYKIAGEATTRTLTYPTYQGPATTANNQ